MKNNGSRGDNTIKLIIGGLLLALVCFAMGKVGIIILGAVVALLVGSIFWDRWRHPPEAPGFKPEDD